MLNGALIIAFLISVVATIILGLIAKWLDRKVTAWVHWRVGPPWYQCFADIAKLLGKEILLPLEAKKSGFFIAPFLGFAGTAVAAMFIWLAAMGSSMSLPGDLIVIIYLLTIPSLAIIIGGASSGGPQAAIGASREMKLIIAYELPFILSIITVVLNCGHGFNLSSIVTYQQTNGIMVSHISGLIAFIVSILCIQAKLGLVPFDLAEAETEIMAGAFTEYSGPLLAVFFMTKYMLLVLLPLLLVSLFLGGINLCGLGPLWAVLKILLVIVILTLIRNTNPRVRIDQAMKFFWFGLAPLSFIALILAVLGY